MCKAGPKLLAQRVAPLPLIPHLSSESNRSLTYLDPRHVTPAQPRSARV
jgi:hypothetical protein